MAFQTTTDLQNQAIGWLRKGCRSLGGGTVVRFPRFWMSSGECRLRYSYSLDGKFSSVTERWASHVAGWLNAPDTLVVRYEDLHQDYFSVLRNVADFTGLRVQKKGRTASVAIDDAPSILPRRGKIGDWRNFLTNEDERLIRSAVERANLDWNYVTYPGDSAEKRLPADIFPC